jgi:hypothetical protein
MLANFAFSKNLIISLNIDAGCIPFDFVFEVYDFFTKMFSNISNIVFSEKNKILNFEPITLKFRVYLPKLFNNDTFTGKISFSDIPDYVRILIKSIFGFNVNDNLTFY